MNLAAGQSAAVYLNSRLVICMFHSQQNPVVGREGRRGTHGLGLVDRAGALGAEPPCQAGGDRSGSFMKHTAGSAVARERGRIGPGASFR
jgi:hypothetical protein